MTNDTDLLISKTFVFENQSTFEYENIDVLLRQDIEEFKIGDIIDIFTHKNAIGFPLSYKIYNAEIDHFIAFDPIKPLSISYIYSPVIMIKYKILPYVPNSTIDPFHKSGQNKRERNRERSIKEVIQKVKKWRQIHHGDSSENGNKNRMNLQDAAKIVGISKKSLDDYFCQLRLAQQYGFNFDDNMDEKIGVIRSYVKKCRAELNLNIKHQRLPKKLRVIQSLMDTNTFDKRQYQQNNGLKVLEQSKSSQQKQEDELSQIKLELKMNPSRQFKQQNLGIVGEDEYLNKFYNSFDLQEQGEYNDPFMILNNKEIKGELLEEEKQSRAEILF